MAKAPMTQKQVDALAKKLWGSLNQSDRWALADQFVSGSFDWEDWFTTKPSSRVLNAMDRLRILWEQSQG